eukprot:COSAG02_NODE_795_length_17133_cov_6.577727_13_plen_83_part_00
MSNFGHSSLSKLAKVTTILNHPLVLSERDFFFTKMGSFDFSWRICQRRGARRARRCHPSGGSIGLKVALSRARASGAISWSR